MNNLYIQANASSGAVGTGRLQFFFGIGIVVRGLERDYNLGALHAHRFLDFAHSACKRANLQQQREHVRRGIVGQQRGDEHARATPIPLSAFTHYQRASEALSINHQGQFPSVTVSFNLAPNAALGSAITAIDKVQKDLHMPATLQADFQGTAASFRNSLSNEALLILAALVTVYIVLGVLYESFIHPMTILSTLPSAGVGALLALMLFGQDLSVVAIIGIILLIGIVKKNGIMMVDFALEGERQHGKNATDAIYEASLLRFRPIMMTTMAALLGGIPLAVGTGIGSEIRRPLGIAMVGRTAPEPGSHLIHNAGDLHLLRYAGAKIFELAFRRNSPAGGDGRSFKTGRAVMNPSELFIRRPVATTLLTIAIAIAGAICVYGAAGFASASGGFSDDLRFCFAAGSECADHGFVGCHAPRAPVRPHRGRNGNDFGEFAGRQRRSRCNSI